MMSGSGISDRVYVILIVHFLIFRSLAQEFGDQPTATDAPLGNNFHDCAKSCYCYPAGNDVIARCSGSEIVGIPRDLPTETTFLDISDSNIVTLRRDEMSYLEKLRRFSLTYNRRLSSIEDGALHNSEMTSIELYGNDLSQLNSYSLALKSVNQISELYIQSNLKLQELEAGFFNAFPRLERLHLGNTSMRFDEKLFQNETTGSYEEHISLLYLNLEHKKMTALNESVLRYLPNLESIYAGYNQIGYIDGQTFSRNPNLKDVHLEWNRLTSVPPSTFSRQRGLHYLDLSGNILTAVESGLLDEMPHNGGLCLSFNPINCDCDAKYLQDWMMQLGRANCLPFSFTECNSPTGVKGQDLTAVTPGEFCEADASSAELGTPVAWIGLSLIILLTVTVITGAACLCMYVKLGSKPDRPPLKRISSVSETPIMSRQLSNISMENYQYDQHHP